MVTPVEHVCEALRARGIRVQEKAGYRLACCPAHDDRTPSLSISEGDDGRALLKCHAGCGTTAIVDALGLSIRDLFPDRPSDDGVVARYVYTDEDGAPLFRVNRTRQKRFYQERFTGSRWVSGLGDTRRVLYRLPEVLAAVWRGDTVYVVEGEKDAEALRMRGVTATTSPMGAGKWRADYSEALAGAHVVIVADKDAPGFEHAARVSEDLRRAGVVSVKVVQALSGKDASDHLEAGHGVDDFYCVDDHIDASNDAHPAGTAADEHGDLCTPTTQEAGFGRMYLGIQDLDDLPPIVEIVSGGVLDSMALFVIGGRGGSYKSFFALDLLACIATGTPFVDREVMRQKVLYVVGEGLWGLAKRRDAWEEAHACRIENDWFHVRTASVNLFRGGAEYDDLLERVRREQYGVIVFDTLQRASAGADANSSRDAGLITERLGEICAVSNAAVGIIAHTGKHEEHGIRGSSAFEDDVDIVWRLTADKSGDVTSRVTATLAKRRNGPEGLELTFRPVRVPNTESIVLESLDRPVSLTHEPTGIREILALLEGDAIPEAGLSASALQEAARWQGKGQLYKALNWLMKSGHVEKNGNGRYPSYRITVHGRGFLAEEGCELG